MKQMEQLESAHQAPIHLLPSSGREVRIITGEFSPDEAREQVITLLTEKLRFYELCSLRNFEYKGKPDLELETKITALKHEIEQIFVLLKHAESQGKTLKVESEIKVSLV